MVQLPASFSLFSSFQYSKQMFADDWIRTADLWCQKRPLYQVPHRPFVDKTKLRSIADIVYSEAIESKAV